MDDAALDEARALLRQGLLQPALVALGRVQADAPAADRASAALLTGNVAYERGRYEQAQASWSRARELYEQSAPGGEGSVAASGNLDLVRAHLERQHELDGSATALRLALALTLALAAAVVGLGYRMSRISSSTGERAR